MTRTLCSAFVLAALAVSAVPLTGCSITNNADGSSTVGPLTKYKGTPASSTIPYTAGSSISIASHNGYVHVTAGASNKVVVTFTPFVLDGDKQDTQAQSQITQFLTLDASANGSAISIEPVIKAGASGTLGADIDVQVPPELSGGFQITQDNGEVTATLAGTPSSTNVQSKNGSVTVDNAGGTLNVGSENGAVDVTVASWGTANGAVTSGNGDVSISLPDTINGKMTAQAEGAINDSSIPATWQVASAAANSKSYTMGDGSGGTVALTTQLGDITIQ